jgi:hypothetical protein
MIANIFENWDPVVILSVALGVLFVLGVLLTIDWLIDEVRRKRDDEAELRRFEDFD